MSSPFQIGFMGKNPMKTIKLNDKDLNSTKSASSQPAAEISYEGQGGVDYENDPRFAENPEGQGGKDYEADDSVAKMTSPLNDRTSRKIKKANKTLKQINKMQNERSSIKDTYSGDPDDLEPEQVRTADEPASRREKRKIKKYKKTIKQLGNKIG